MMLWFRRYSMYVVHVIPLMNHLQISIGLKQKQESASNAEELQCYKKKKQRFKKLNKNQCCCLISDEALVKILPQFHGCSASSGDVRSISHCFFSTSFSEEVSSPCQRQTAQTADCLITVLCLNDVAPDEQITVIQRFEFQFIKAI